MACVLGQLDNRVSTDTDESPFQYNSQNIDTIVAPSISGVFHVAHCSVFVHVDYCLCLFYFLMGAQVAQ